MAKDSFESHDEMDVPASRADGLGNAVIILTGIILLVAIILVRKATSDKFESPTPAPSPAATR